MKNEEIVRALRRLKVETGSLVCMGCGREHNCGILGCRIVREAAELSRYGAQAQITMAFEEMAELQDVLCKFLRGRVDGDTLANIAEEIADVGIMLDQMAVDFEVEDGVAEQRAHKVRRLRSRLEYVEQEG